MIKAVVFDLDGTLVDTETCAYEAMRDIYKQHGQELPLDKWSLAIGTHGGFDGYGYLEERIGRKLDRKAIHKQFWDLHEERVSKMPLRPGVLARLEEARELGLKIGLASSSQRWWIEKVTTLAGIREYFEAVCSADDVERVKPDPALYLHAAQALGVAPGEAIAIEDSMNGLRAAKAAGLVALVTPNPVTSHMDFSGADAIVQDLEHITFAELAGRYPASSKSK
ncbi:HAD family hydrolase [Cohnella panacarvi]|uniref:HAD family hydrolase n=1 Tax=Cohnella panacarvi TaxID=400776 RepID=UPI000479F203|nr:HAD family hydrolase [Cohnella panacarvi]